MQRKSKLLLIFTVIASILMVSLAGCTIYVTPKDDRPTVTAEPDMPPMPETEEPMTEEETEPTQSVTTEPTTQKSDNDWRDMSITINDVQYKIPFSYQLLEQNGWTFDLSEYGYDNGYVLNEGQSVTSTIYLKHPDFNDGFDCSIGFVNNSTEKKDILDCDIWAIDMNMEFAHDKYPKIQLAHGLTWGDSLEKAKEYFGEPEDTYHFDESGRVADTLTYGNSWKDSQGIMKLTFINNKLTAFSLKQY